MLDTVVLTLVDGVRIVVPDVLNLITPYVLREQHDFFEDELPFVRQVLQPGQKAIDIGANFGVYTLPMAQRVGATGHVWAFEPSLSTARFLAQSVEANGFRHVTLEQKAVSSAPGSGQLTLHVHPELRSLVHGTVQPGASEEVTLVTLDDCMERYEWRDIDLLKIDAEGEEANIVKGGRRFFDSLAPLVQYELRTNATDMNFDLISGFAAIGYDSYRFLPGLNLLVPFDAESPPDSYQLNLFCCNVLCASKLSLRRLLLRHADLAGADNSLESAGTPYHWRQTLAHLPYAKPLMSVWQTTKKAGDDCAVEQAIAFYARSRDVALTMAQRYRALEASFLHFQALCEREPSHLRLASFARVAHDFGQRTVVVNSLNRLVDSIRLSGSVDASEPFLAPLARFDTIAPGEMLGNWILAAALEQLEQRERFSSFYAGARALDRLEAIETLGFGSPSMKRRLELVRLCIDRARMPIDRQPQP
jgi:FkbM family methyltransferase